MWLVVWKIKDAATKLNDIPNDEVGKFQAVILHVGSTDFPVSSEKDFDNLYMEYVEIMSDISTKCSKAAVLISSVLPRNDQLGTKRFRNTWYTVFITRGPRVGAFQNELCVKL